MRITGLDLARCLALAGMVIVNFDIVLTAPTVGADKFVFVKLLAGRAAAIFVIVAGIGFGLSSRSKDFGALVKTYLKRIAFLLVIGLLNMLIFPADIIHYYAFYFLFALTFVRVKNKWLWGGMVVLPLLSTFMLLLLDFDKGWNWETYEYSGFWTLRGFVRNLFFNGWHPVLPWLSFFLYGMWLSRLNLTMVKNQRRMMVMGTLIFICVIAGAQVLRQVFQAVDPELPLLFGVEPVPATLTYLLSAGALATAIIGGCLSISQFLPKAIPDAFNAMGRMTLTLYFAHIVIGMGAAQYLGWLEALTHSQALLYSLVFIGLCLVFASTWARYFTRGPLEAVMRRVCG